MFPSTTVKRHAVAPKHHLYLSPHFDDAALSCGGMIHACTKQGEAVSVLTVCAGGPPVGPLSDYAYGLHERWGQKRADAQRLAADMIEIRRNEDRAALRMLGAEARFLDVPDVIYRRMGGSGAWTVDSDEALFRGFEPSEHDLLRATAYAIEAEIERIEANSASSPGTGTHMLRLYIPLAAGDHIDHHLVHQAAERLLARRPELRANAAWYEDYPYAEDPEAVASALEGKVAWSPDTVLMRAEDLEAKVASIACYASQISTFWGSLDQMETAVKKMARRVAGDDPSKPARFENFAERLWRPASPGRA